MRAALILLGILVALSAGLASCTHACPSPSPTPMAAIALPAATSSATRTQPIDVRFVAMASAGNVAQIVLLTTAVAENAAGEPLLDLDGHPFLDPNEPASAPATTVARVRDYTTGTAELWLDERTHWRDMRGHGVGSAPILPPAFPNGAFVAIGGATSVVRFPLSIDDTTDAGVPALDAGLAPQQSRPWEWVWPTTGPTASDATLPALNDVVVVPQNAPAPDIALVSRTVVAAGGAITGGELFVLDIDDPTQVISLATLSFESYAEAGLHAVPSGLAYADGIAYVAIDHQNFGMVPQLGRGMLAVIDPAMRSVRTVLHFPTLTNCTSIAPYHPPTRTTADVTDPGENHRLVLTCMGSAPATVGSPPTDAGFVYIEYDPAQPDRLPTVAQTITARSLALPRPDGGSMPLFGHWMAYVSRGSLTPVVADRVIAVNLSSGAMQILASAPTSNPVSSVVGFGVGSFDASSGVLVVPNGFDGVMTWQAPRGFTALEGSGTGYAFRDPIRVPITGCGHLAARVVRAIGGGAATLTPRVDAGMPEDAAIPTDDAATPMDDAGTDAS